MPKFRTILIILGLLLLTTMPLFYFLSQEKNKPLSHVALRLLLGQTQDYKLSLKTLAVEDAYPSDYKLQVPFGYYTVKITGDNDATLFQGAVNKNLVRYPPDEVGDESEPGPTPDLTLEPLSEILLLLPYYPQAKNIVILDENNMEKMQIDVNKLEVLKDFSRNLCGNGICDFSENFLVCFKDCGFRLR